MELATYLSELSARRAERAAELQSALENGYHILHDGLVWPECSPFLASHNTPHQLASHIECREHGFGMRTVILSSTKLALLGYVKRADGQWHKMPRQEAEVERNVDPSPFYGLRGDS